MRERLVHSLKIVRVYRTLKPLGKSDFRDEKKGNYFISLKPELWI